MENQDKYPYLGFVNIPKLTILTRILLVLTKILPALTRILQKPDPGVYFPVLITNKINGYYVLIVCLILL